MTKFYLRNLASNDAPSNGEKSTALPVGTFKGNSGTGFEDRSLETTAGSSQTFDGLTSLAQTAHQDNYIYRFTSKALAAQTINANTWTLAVATSEGNAAANSFTIASIYVWRPSTQAVVGFIYDSDTALGVEWGATEDGQVLSPSGSAVTVQANDVLVLEFWRHAVQAMGNAYTQLLYYNGATDVTDTTTSDAASYLETPQTLTFAGIDPARSHSAYIDLDYNAIVASRAHSAYIDLDYIAAARSHSAYIDLDYNAEPTFTEYGGLFYYDPSNWGSVSFFLEADIKATSGTAFTRLFDVTSGIEVTSGRLSTTSTSLIRLRSAALTLTSGREYRAEFGKVSPDAGAFRNARLVVV